MKLPNIIIEATLLFFIFSKCAFTATTATLNLKGTVPAILELSIVPEIIATTLPLNVSQTSTKIATITERSNSNSGHKVSIASQNNGHLKRATGTDLFPYNLTYNGNNVNLATGQTFTFVFTNAAPQTKDINITYTGSDNLKAGEYYDAITLTISTN